MARLWNTIIEEEETAIETSKTIEFGSELRQSDRSIRKQIKTATKRKYREFLKGLQSDRKDNPKNVLELLEIKNKICKNS